MTDSIFDFKSRTYASTIVPRELALGACSRGSVCAWGDDYIILILVGGTATTIDHCASVK